jgi:hypothetical protein
MLHLLAPLFDEQIALLQLIARDKSLEDATDIRDAWEAAFTCPNDPLLPHGFHQSVTITLTSHFTDLAALNAQLNDLVNRASGCIPTKLFTVPTEEL